MNINLRRTPYFLPRIFLHRKQRTGTQLLATSVLLTALLLIWAGCRSERTSPASNSTEESTGLLERAWDGEAKLEPEKVLAIGGTSSDIIIGNIRDIDIDSEGRMYIADGEYHSVKVVSPAGKLIQEIGREGRGPGEFVELASLEVGPEDSLFTLDSELNRVTVYGPDEARERSGKEVGQAYTVQLPRPERPNGYPARLMKPDTSGFLVEYRTGFPLPEGVSKRRWVALLGANGTILSDSVVAGAGPPLMEGAITTEHPFGTTSLYRLAPDHKILIGGHTDSLIFRKHSLSGRSTLWVSLPHRTIPLTDADMTRRLEDLPSQVKDKFLEAMRNPEIDTQPVFEDFLIGEEGRLWIDVADGSEAKSIWLTVGEDGKIQSTYSFPNAVTLELVVGEKAYGVRSQASGAPEVVVYGLRADV